MDISRSLLKDFAKISNDPSKKSPSFTYVRGTVQTVGNKKYVRIDGSNGLTPISEVVNAENGDRVLVTIENHIATILGNFSYPPSSRNELEALDKADSANNKVNEAVNKAEQAWQKADDAMTNVDAAFVLAEESKKKADDAFIAADTANKNIEETKGLANTAITQSGIAMNEASQAQSNVAIAQNEINRIDKVVEVVKGDVNSAITDLHNLAGETTAIKQSMELEYTKKTELSEVETALRSEISQSVGEIRTEMSETYATKSYVDSIKNGNTNLAVGTSSKWSEWIIPNASSTNDSSTGAVANLPIGHQVNDKYTSQIEIEFLGVKKGSGTDEFKFFANGLCKEIEDSTIQENVEVVWGPKLINLTTPPEDGIHKFTYTYTVTENTRKYHVVNLDIKADNWDGIGKYRYRCIKIEKGDKASDWTPAPSDITTNDALVEIEGKLQSQIIQNASSILTTVTKVEKIESDTYEAQKLVSDALSNAFDSQSAAELAEKRVAELTKRIDNAETAIKQNSDNILLTSSKTTEIGNDLKNNYWTKGEAEEIISTVSKKTETVKSTKEQFYLSNSPTVLDGGSWLDMQPSWMPKKYIWRRTLITYADGRNEYTPSSNGVCITGNDGEAGKDAIILQILSSNGNLFKNSAIATTLSVTIIVADKMISSSADMYKTFGNDAKLIWEQKLFGSETFEPIDPLDSRLSDNGFLMTLNSNDVFTQTVFNCKLLF